MRNPRTVAPVAGFSLVEVLVVVAIIGTAIALMLNGSAGRAQRTADVTATASEVLAYAERMRTLSTGMDYSGVTVAQAVALLDPAWIVNPATAVQRHGLGGTLTFAKVNVGPVVGAAFSLTAAQLTSESCREFVRQIEPRMYRVLVGTTVVKASPTAPVSIPTVQTACNATASPTVRWELLL